MGGGRRASGVAGGEVGSGREVVLGGRWEAGGGKSEDGCRSMSMALIIEDPMQTSSE